MESLKEHTFLNNIYTNKLAIPRAFNMRHNEQISGMIVAASVVSTTQSKPTLDCLMLQGGWLAGQSESLLPDS